MFMQCQSVTWPPCTFAQQSLDERSGMQKRLYFPEREMRQSYFPSVPSDTILFLDFLWSLISMTWGLIMQLRARNWSFMSVFGIGWGDQATKNILYCLSLGFRQVKREHFSSMGTYIEQHSETFQREAPVVTYRHKVFPPLEARKLKNGTITYSEPHISHVEKQSMLSYQSKNPDLFSVRMICFNAMWVLRLLASKTMMSGSFIRK